MAPSLLEMLRILTSLSGRYGSAREVLTGLLRTLPDPEAPPWPVLPETTRRLPRMVREQRPALRGIGEVAGMLADQIGASGSMPGLLAHLTGRWTPGPLARRRETAFPYMTGLKLTVSEPTNTSATKRASAVQPA